MKIKLDDIPNTELRQLLKQIKGDFYPVLALHRCDACSALVASNSRDGYSCPSCGVLCLYTVYGDTLPPLAEDDQKEKE